MLSSGRNEGGGLVRPLGPPLGPALYSHRHGHHHLHHSQVPLYDSSDDEYGSCSEAPLYENLEDLDDDHDGDDGGVYENVVPIPSQEVYENVVFEPPTYTNLLAPRRDDEMHDDDPQVYANLPTLEEIPTYDVPQRKQPSASQEYANLQPPKPSVQSPSAGAGLGIIVEESETSSARSSAGSSAAESTPTSAASSLGRGGCSSLTLGARPARPLSNGLSPGSPSSKSHPLVVGLTPKAQQQSTEPQAQARRQEQLARVQQQVKEHLRQEEERQPEEPQQKRSVRDLLGHFEAQGSNAQRLQTKFTVRKTLSQPIHTAQTNGGAPVPAVSSCNASRTSFLQSLTSGSGGGGGCVSNSSAKSGGSGGGCISNSSAKSGSGGGCISNSSAKSGSGGGCISNSSAKSGGAPSESPAHRRWSSGSNGLHSNREWGNASAKDVGDGERVTAATASDRLGAINKDKFTSGVKVKPWGSHEVRDRGGPPVNGESKNKDWENGVRSVNGDARNARRTVSYNMECLKNEVNRAEFKLNNVKLDESSKAASSNGRAKGAPGAANKAVNGAVSVDGESASDSKVTAVDGAVSEGGESASDSKVTAVDTRQPRARDQDIPSIINSLPDDDPCQGMESRRTTSSWDPSVLVNALYVVPEPLRDKPRPKDRVNIEGFLERLPSGRTKATFWNAWKRCYFRAKDGFLYCYASKHSDQPIAVTQLMGGTLETFESMIITAQDRNPAMVPMIGIDDRMGHYLVVRANTPQETERWTLALKTHTVEDFCSTYVQPWPVPRAPALLRDSIVIDLGSCSVRAGVLCTQPSLPQLFFPAVCATRRSSRSVLRGADKGPDRVYGSQALHPKVRANSMLSYPIRQSDKINKHTVDLAAVSGLVSVVLQWLAVDPRDYGLVLSVPRALDAATQTRLVADLFDNHGLRSVVLSHQSVLALYAYNASSGVVVDIGERADVVPIMDGYIVEGGVSRVPYGGEQVVGHVRRFLLQRAPPLSFSTVPEALLPRLALEKLCFVSSDYRADLKRAQRDPGEMAASVSVREYFAGERDPAIDSLTLDVGRFQAPEGLFHPQAWGLDMQGVHKMVHKAIQECSMDARKTMARSVFLAGGLTMLPGFPERLREELTALLPAAVSPKVHASPYRYHAAYIGACALANSSGVDEMRLTREEWNRDGGRLLQPWIL